MSILNLAFPCQCQMLCGVCLFKFSKVVEKCIYTLKNGVSLTLTVQQ
jgi:hypothetical protein